MVVKEPLDNDTKIHPVDAHVGKRLRLRRQSLKITQEKLADALGLTFQQVQKYENGANRISASRLFDIAKALQAPISYFFEGMVSFFGHQSPLALHEKSVSYDFSTASQSKDEKEILALFKKIKDPKSRQEVLILMRKLSDL